jgi:hypothetical protein
MPTPYEDELDPGQAQSPGCPCPECAEDFTICPTCGEDLPHHLCDGRSPAEHE